MKPSNSWKRVVILKKDWLIEIFQLKRNNFLETKYNELLINNFFNANSDYF
jgi:hypothetical protein